jgi:nitroreductase/NAD-dependent dihydropyrimidine dehydrogenase PreA subunit
MTLVKEPESKPAEITINTRRCKACGLCVKVCNGPLYMDGSEVKVDHSRGFGCVECGHCGAVCPQDAVKVKGRDLGPEDYVKAPPKRSMPTLKVLKNLMEARRSMRSFKKRPVSKAAAAKILDAAATAPMGMPPSGVEVLVLHGRDKVREFRDDLLECMISSRWMFKPFMLKVLSLFMGKRQAEMLGSFVAPMIDHYEERRMAGVDVYLYEAPLAMYFHASPGSDAADPVIAATYAVLAAEAMGLGSCIIGMTGPFLSRSKELKKKYGVPQENREGLMVVFGHPAIKFRRTVKRRLGRVHYY